LRAILAAAALSLFSVPAFAAGALPDGTYECLFDVYIAGEMEIVGNTYKGPAFNGQYEGTYEYSIEDQTIFWNGPVGGYTEDGFEVLGTIIVKDGNGKLGFQMQVRQDGGSPNAVVCMPKA